MLLKKLATHVHGLSGDQSLQLVILTTTDGLGTLPGVAKLAKAWLFWQGLFLYKSFRFKCLMIVRHFIPNDIWNVTRFCGTLNVRCCLDNISARLISPDEINPATAGQKLLHALLYEHVSTELSNDLRPILLTWLNCTPNITWHAQWSGLLIHSQILRKCNIFQWV